MKFGKLPSIDNVDFNLPAESPHNQTVLAALPKLNTKANLYVGCTGWSMKEWIGTVYPNGTKTKDYLKHYSKQFNTIEFNTTHYRIPTKEIIENWQNDAAEDFKFCPKIPQSISHSADLGLVKDTIKIFCDAISGLNDKLGCCFMQLPPYFDKSRIALLETFLKAFPRDIPLSIEVRHESWFENDNNLFFELMEKYNTAAVITDVAGRRDVLHQRICNNTSVIRFVGNDLDPSDFKRADQWIEQLKKWIEAGLQNIYFFTHEPDNIQSPEMADYFVKKALEELDVNVRGPQFYDANEGKQISLF